MTTIIFPILTFSLTFIAGVVLGIFISSQIEKRIEKSIEKESKKSDEFWSGRTTQNTVVVFPKQNFSPGDFVDVRIENCTSATLIGVGLKISKNI